MIFLYLRKYYKYGETRKTQKTDLSKIINMEKQKNVYSYFYVKNTNRQKLKNVYKLSIIYYISKF